MNDHDDRDIYGNQPSKHVSCVSLLPFIILFGGAALLVLIARSCNGSIVTEHFLDALERVESHGRATALGDRGRARGPFQFQAAAWADVNTWKTSSGHPPVSYLRGSTNRAAARCYARTYLKHLESRLAAMRRVHPTTEQLFAAWNLGFEGFRRRGFLLSRCPAVTRRSARQLCNILADTPKATGGVLITDARASAKARGYGAHIAPNP